MPDATETQTSPTSPSRAQEARALKWVAVLAGALALVIYVSGVWFFSQTFYPDTAIGSVDVSLSSFSEAERRISRAAAEYSLSVSGEGSDFTIASQDIRMSVDAQSAVASARSRMQVLLWPAEMVGKHIGNAPQVEYDHSLLGELVAESLDSINASATVPVDAIVTYDEPQALFVVQPEVAGTKLSESAVMSLVRDCIDNLEPEARLSPDHLVAPQVTSDDPLLHAATKRANDLTRARFSIALDGTGVVDVDRSVLERFVVFDSGHTVSLDEAKMGAWADGVEKSLNTVGSERTYTRPDGKVVTVKGGTYGWKTQADGVSDKIVAAVSAGETTGTIDVAVTQTANVYGGPDGIDWGRWIDVDLSEQHARFYDETGTPIWESDIVTGRPGMGTPTGVWKLNNRLRSVTLVGRIMPETGEPEYRTPVAYWIPFVRNSIGFHDATWQSRFGGSRYVQGFGSHGCVNLPLSAAKTLYGLVKVGDCVIVHW